MTLETVAGPALASAAHYAVGSVLEVRQDTADTWTLTLDVPAPMRVGEPGQFLMLDLPAFSPVPISVSRYRPEAIELTIRAAGASTRAICAMQPGEQIGLRGPLGRAWPTAAAVGRDVIVVAGGIGLAPLRPLIDAVVAERRRHGRFLLALGFRTPGDLLFPDDIEAWASEPANRVAVTVDRADGTWQGRVGLVTGLLDGADIDAARAIAFICGPERMMQATATRLAELGVAEERIVLTLERHMECGIGLCGHCQMGRFFVCRDGPVFSRAELGDDFEREGI